MTAADKWTIAHHGWGIESAPSLNIGMLPGRRRASLYLLLPPGTTSFSPNLIPLDGDGVSVLPLAYFTGQDEAELAIQWLDRRLMRQEEQ